MAEKVAIENDPSSNDVSDLSSDGESSSESSEDERLMTPFELWCKRAGLENP